MATVTIDIPDELSAELAAHRDRLPELLALSLRQPAVPADIYRSLVDFLVQQPTDDQVLAFCPTPAMQHRLTTLIERDHQQQLTAAESAELAEFERIEHLIIMLKAGSLAHLVSRP